MFLFLNSIHSDAWDIIFSVITSRESWIPLFLVLIVMMATKFKWQTLYVGLFLGLVFALGDQISVKLFKEVFERLRPCHNNEIAHLVHTINGKCGGRFSFVSSHATNSFAVAVFMGLVLRNQYRFILPALLFWATIVSYSRIYVGVHYPADILCGALLGTIIALFVYFLIKVFNNRFNLNIKLNP